MRDIGSMAGIGNRLRLARRAAKLSQDEVAVTLGTTQQTVAKWEAGRAAMGIDRLMQVCVLYGKSYDFILSGKEQYSSCPPEGRLSCRIIYRGCGGCEDCMPT